MSKTKPYFHDRVVLLILTINTFLLLVCIVAALLPLADSTGTIIAEYRSNLGLDGYRAGTTLDILSFGIFAIIVYALQLYASMKLYTAQRPVSIITLILTTLLLIFTLIVSNALIELR